jgi:hypothetical protein
MQLWRFPRARFNQINLTSYDDTGRVSRERRPPGLDLNYHLGLQPVTAYEYDPAGNMSKLYQL